MTLDELRQSLRLRLTAAATHVEMGARLERLGRYDEALAAYDRALALKPDFLEALQNRSLALLRLGRFKSGWRDYVTRFKRPQIARAVLTEPHGEDDLAGRHVLLVGEQGLGDELFFLRFMPELRRRGAARITYAGAAKLATMLARLDGLDDVLDSRGELPPADTTIAIGDLPLVLRMTARSHVPASIVLPPRAADVANIAARLAAFGPPPYIGVTWRAGIADQLDALFKLAPLDAMGGVLRGLPGSLIALQRHPKDGEIDALAAVAGKPLLDLTALNENLEAMLALAGALDEYVTVSNTNVHLRAAAPSPAHRSSRVLVPHPPEFRWMAEGEESPWFPGSRIYRQDIGGGWQTALDSLRRDLLAAFGQASA